jgi:hypothetical protein
MTTKYHIYEMSLIDSFTGKQLAFDGWVRATEHGLPTKVALYSEAEVVQSSYGLSFTDGQIKIKTLATVEAIDLYVFTDKGYFAKLINIVPGSVREVPIDLGRIDQTLILPFDILDDDIAAATEVITPIVLAKHQLVLPWGIGAQVETADSGITLDVGTESTSGTNDPDGFIDGILMTTATWVSAQVGYDIGTNNIGVDITGAEQEWTTGVLLHPTNTKAAAAEQGDAAATDGNGFYSYVPYPAGNTGAAAYNEYLSFTLSSGADTAAGFIVIPTRINPILSLL